MCVRSWLDRQFPGRWIGRRGPLEWPPRSPNLTSTLFLLVGGIWRSWCTSWKYSYLKERNRDECARITPDMLKGFRHEWERLIRMCYKCNGPHIEHVLLIKRPFSPIYLDSWITLYIYHNKQPSWYKRHWYLYKRQRIFFCRVWAEILTVIEMGRRFRSDVPKVLVSLQR
jgi:hypothetical protein